MYTAYGGEILSAEDYMHRVQLLLGSSDVMIGGRGRYNSII